MQTATLSRKGQKPAKVAVKKLRPAGTENQRLRVAVVTTFVLDSCSQLSMYTSGSCSGDKIWSGLAHPNIVRLIGYHLDLEGDVMWLISTWESLGNIVDYLATNSIDEDARVSLVRPLIKDLNITYRRSLGSGHCGRSCISPHTEASRMSRRY